MNSLNLSCINVRGLRSPKVKNKTEAICLILAKGNQDLVCLLDTHLDEKTEDRLKAWPGKSFFSHNRFSNNTGGIALLTRNVSISKTNIKSDENGRYLLFKLCISDINLCCAVVYAPADSSKSRRKFFKSLKNIISKFKGKDDKVILIGDFNCVEFPSLDRSDAGNFPDNSVNFLQDINSDFDLLDLWRQRNPTEKTFTYFSENSDRASRLDRIYVSSDINHFFYKTTINPFAFSDHSEVSFSFAVNSDHDTKDSPEDNWVFNASLLNDPTYVGKINDFWQVWQNRKSSFTSLQHWWDKGKERIKTLTRTYSHRKSKARNKILKSLYKKLRNAQNQGKSPLIKAIKHQICTIESEHARSHFLNLKLDWVEDSERCTKTFLNLHAKRKAETFVNSIQDSKGKVQKDTSKILDVFSTFYKDLYTQHYINENDQEILLDDLDMQTLSEVEKEGTAEPLTQEDLKQALCKLANGKSPGSDGLTAELYKGFWDLLGQDYYQVVSSSFEADLLPLSQRIATIKCLPKKGDITEVKNWRPISLLNVDYKILSKALCLRLLKFLPSIISEE